MNASLAQIEGYDWLIFSSGNAVDFFFSVVTDSEFKEMSNGLKIAAVGPMLPPAKLEGHQVTVDFMPGCLYGEAIGPGPG